MYPKCGCADECRFCNYLAKRDPKAKTQVAMLVVFKPGVTVDQAKKVAENFGKDTAASSDVQTFRPDAVGPVIYFP